MRKTKNDETKKTELALRMRALSVEPRDIFGKKKLNASPKYQWAKDWKAFEILVHEKG